MKPRAMALSLPGRLLLRLGLHRRIALFVSTMLVAVFAAIGLLGWEAVHRSIDATLDERRATTLVVARHLDDVIGHAHGHLMVIAGQLSREDALADQARTSGTLDAMLPQVRFFFTRLLVFDPTSKLVATSPGAALDGLSEDSREQIERTMRLRQPTISNLLYLPIENTLGVLFTAPISRDGELLGVVAAEMPLPHPSISGIGESIELGLSGHMEVVDGRGWVLTSTSVNDIFLPSEHSGFYGPLLVERSTTVARALYEERDGVFEEDEDAEWHVMAFVPLSHAPWGVGLGQSENETLAGARDLRDRTLSVAAIALVTALLCAYIGTQTVASPIRTLTRLGERMATGDLSHPIAIHQPDEIGRLGQVLETTRQRLRQSLDDITAWNRELEQRVEARTHQLEVSNRHLQALLAVSTVAGRGDQQAVLREALRQLVETLGARGGWALLRENDDQPLRLAAGFKLPPTLHAADVAISAPDVACVEAVRTGRTVSQVVADCSALPDGLGRPFADTRCWCTPIRVGEQTLGSLCLATAAARELDSEQLALVEAVAQQVAVSFEHARLTEATAKLEAARTMELLRAEFLGSVSHELRTPLGFIKGYTTTLLRNDVTWSDDERREFLEIIDEESDRLTELVNSLLDAARVQAGRLRLHLAPVPLEEVVRRSVERLNGILGNHRLRIGVDASPTIMGDESRLGQVVVNLVQNAVKYSPGGGPIEVRVGQDGSCAVLDVLDRGIGISSTDAERMFEPFFRASGVTTSRIGGAGLGLAICRAVVEAHDGEIRAEPRSHGGTAIHVRLPVQADGTPEGA